MSNLTGQYNWKTLLDNCTLFLSLQFLFSTANLFCFSDNECYHCQTSHPGIAKTTDLKTYFVKPKDHYIGHHAVAKPGFKEGHRQVSLRLVLCVKLPLRLAEMVSMQGSDIYPYFMFPFSSITVTPNYIYTMRVVPTGPTTTSVGRPYWHLFLFLKFP